MKYICIQFTDGTNREWYHEGRSGGSWTKTIETKDGWVTVVDEYGSKVSFPSSIVKEVKTRE